MICPKCKSENVKIQIVSEEVVRVYKHGLIYKLFVGWWIWIFRSIFKLLFMPFSGLFSRTEKYSNTEHKTMAICQNCGRTWRVK